MADKLIHNTNNDTQNYSFCRLQLVFLQHLDTQLNNQPITNQLQKKGPKVIEPTIKKTLL